MAESALNPSGNPLLDFSGLPRFAEIRPEHVSPAVDELLAQARAAVAVAESAAPTWEAFVSPLEDAHERLGRAWGQIEHLHSVCDSPALRETYNANLSKVTGFWTEYGQNHAIFEKYQQLSNSKDFLEMSPSRKKVVKNALTNFHLGGANLSEEMKPRFTAIEDELASLSAKFAENVMDATNSFAILVTDLDRLSGLPDDTVNEAREAATRDGNRGWKFSLQMPSYWPTMQYAEDRSLRESLYKAYVTRASEFGDSNLDNTLVISRMLSLRHEEAQLLGYSNYATMSLVQKMADTPEQIEEFLENLAVKARKQAEHEVAELFSFAESTLGLRSLEAWDIAFASEKLRRMKFDFSDHEIKRFFPLDAVFNGFTRLVEQLFGISIRHTESPVWHKDVRLFEVCDVNGHRIGYLYADLYARSGKRDGAWMGECIGRKVRHGAVQLPVAYMNADFARPADGAPTLLTHNDVLTFFHEFGHVLHHLLTRVEDLSVSGIHGVEWDAIELPSQLMENFCWNYAVLADSSRHIDTKEPLPISIFEKMLSARQFQAGIRLTKQIELALIDLHIHSKLDHAHPDSLSALINSIRDRIAVLKPPAFHRTLNSFSHVFAGAYAAGYFSYLWAEVLSADAYSTFAAPDDQQLQRPNSEAGGRFLNEVLAVGGSRPAMESFVAFLGRPPSIEALLNQYGVA